MIEIKKMIFALFLAIPILTFGQKSKKYIQPISQIKLTESVSDLEFLDSWIGNKKVIGLGEVTHGSKEIFEFKTRLVQYLAMKKNAQAIIIEANMAECAAINDYVISGNGNPIELIKGLKIKTMNYKEYVDLLQLLKNINTKRGETEKIEFWGYDVQAPQSAANYVLNYLSTLNFTLPDTLKTEIDNFIKTGKSIFTINPSKVPEYKKPIERLYQYVQNNKLQIINKSDEDKYLFNERLVYSISQSFQLFTAASQMDAFFMRDKLGFENIKWIIETKKKRPVIYWAHNAHVLKKELFFPTFITTGNYLYNEYKQDYLAIGSVFYEGSVKAIRDEKKPAYETIDLPRADSLSAETFFSKQKAENFFLNIPVALKIKEWNKLLTDTTTIRSIGSAYEPNTKGRNYRQTIFNQQYDLIFYIRKSNVPIDNK